MQRLTNNPILCRTNREALSPRSFGSYARGYADSLWVVLLLAGTVMLSACGGSSSHDPQQSASFSGNWQFSMTNPDPTTPQVTQYGLQGGFLLQNNGALTGQAVYSISGWNQSTSQWLVCDSGSAPITGTVSGQTVNLTAVAGSQTFALASGTLGSDGKVTGGTFTTLGGTAAGFSSCGLPATTAMNLPWNVIPVPPLSGSITGSFHTYQVSPSGLYNQAYAVTGSLTQGENIGASSATVTGTLSFLDPTTGLSDYPCIPAGIVSVNGQISGNTVILQLIGVDGSNSGQIGVPASQAGLNGLQPVTFQPSGSNGSYILHSAGLGYLVSTKACPNPNSSGGSSEDVGYLCLALNGSIACQLPITLTPGLLTFPPQLLVACATPGATSDCSQVIQGTPATETITLTNNASQELDGLTLNFTQNQSDFSLIDNFAETDTCAPADSPPQTPFNLSAGQSCTLTISFSPQQSCPWGPTPGNTQHAGCLNALTSKLTVTTPADIGNITEQDNQFAVPITGTGLSYLQPSTDELDFGAEGAGEASLPQLLSFTNYGASSVRILPPRDQNHPCQYVYNYQFQFQLPLTTANFGQVAGLQVAANGGGENISVGNGLANYPCDVDPPPPLGSGLPNFQISSDTCSGTDIQPGASCSLEITFVPQPFTFKPGTAPSVDYSLALNTLTCTTNQPNDCEVDSGRFPVELTANNPSPLRILPAAGLDFGSQTVGKASTAQTVTLFDDPNDPAFPGSPAVNFVGKIQVSGNYSESDDCPFSLTPGSSCTLTITFKPKAAGFNGGKLSIVYTLGSAGASANPQFVYLRGTGQ
jgi:hypothetical protein